MPRPFLDAFLAEQTRDVLSHSAPACLRIRALAAFPTSATEALKWSAEKAMMHRLFLPAVAARQPRRHRPQSHQILDGKTNVVSAPDAASGTRVHRSATVALDPGVRRGDEVASKARILLRSSWRASMHQANSATANP